MKIYTYIDNDLMKTDEVTLLIKNKKELLHLREFIDLCILLIENNKFEHEHLSDFLHAKKYKLSSSEFIIAKAPKQVKKR